MCLPCLGGAADDVVVTPDPVSTSEFRYIFCLPSTLQYLGFNIPLNVDKSFTLFIFCINKAKL